MRKVLFGAIALSLVLGMGGAAWATPLAVNTWYDLQYSGIHRGSSTIAVNIGGSPYNVYGGTLKYDFTGVGGDNSLSIDYTAPEYGYDSKATVTENNNMFFLTFCIESRELTSGVNAGKLNYTESFDENDPDTTNAVQGGTGSSTGDPISKATAWLYYAFARDLLGFDYNSGGVNGAGFSGTDVDVLQKTIWYLEGEWTGTFDNKYLTAAAGLGYDIDYDSSEHYDVSAPIATEYRDGNTYDYYVYAVNAEHHGSTYITQDGLFMMAEITEGVIPEPSTFLIWGVGVLVAGLFCRRVR